MISIRPKRFRQRVDTSKNYEVLFIVPRVGLRQGCFGEAIGETLMG